MKTLLSSSTANDFNFSPPLIPFAVADSLLNTLDINPLTMLRIMHDKCPDFARALKKEKIQNIKAADISEGRGFLSHILRITVQFADPKQYCLSFVVKIPQTETYDAIVDSFSGSAGSSTESENSPTGSLNDQSTSDISSTHDVECDFYELFGSSTQVPVGLPKVYYTRRNSASHRGMIFMEDLSGLGACGDVLSSLNVQQCRNMAVAVARLQAHYNFMSKNRRDMISSDKCTYTSPYKQQFVDSFLVQIGVCGQDFVNLVGQLQPFTNIRFTKYALIDRAKQEGCTTLCHGDLWTNNVLFKKTADGTLSDDICALIDWQTAFQGNPLFDLSFLLASSTNVHVRAQIAIEIVDLYFDTLATIYEEHAKPLSMTRKQAHTLYKLCQIQQAPLLGALMCLFNQKLEMSCPDKGLVDEKKSIIRERTKAVMADAVSFVHELGLSNSLGFDLDSSVNL